MEALRNYNPNMNNEPGLVPESQAPLRRFRDDELVAAASLVVNAAAGSADGSDDESHTSDYEDDSSCSSLGGEDDVLGLTDPTNQSATTTSNGTCGGGCDSPTDTQMESTQLLSPSNFSLKQYDAGRMSLGKSEKRYALKIKAAVEEDPDLDNLSDFMYAQFAIVSLQESRSLSEDLPAVLERIESLQQLRQELFVRDTIEHGMEMMTKVLRLLPAWFLAMSFLPDKGCYLRVCNLTNFDMSIFTDPIKVRTWLAAVYYINHCHVPDLEAARQGFVQFVECKGYDWRSQSMFHIKAFSEAAPSFALYPILCKQTVHYHTSMFVRLLTSMARRLLPKHMTEGFEFEAECEFGESLEAVFCEPNLEESAQRLLLKLKETLQQRYQNEQNFELK